MNPRINVDGVAVIVDGAGAVIVGSRGRRKLDHGSVSIERACRSHAVRMVLGNERGFGIDDEGARIVGTRSIARHILTVYAERIHSVLTK